MVLYLIVHLICFVGALAFIVAMDDKITVGSMTWTLICGPLALGLFLAIAMFTNKDPVIWERKR